MSMEADPTKLLLALSRRLQGDPRFMAHVLSVYSEQEGLGEDDLARELDSPPELLVRLALCKRPDADSVDFAEQVQRLSDYTLIDEDLLTRIIRQVDSLAALAEYPGVLGPEASTEAPVNLGSGVLAAARDREEHAAAAEDVDRTGEGGDQ